MIDTQHNAFLTYYHTIALPTQGYHTLTLLRESVRRVIVHYFEQVLHLPQPTFATQGSYHMHTIVSSHTGGNDIDDGVYLQHLPNDTTLWPTPLKILTLIAHAVNTVSYTTPRIRRACVVVYAPDGNQVDLPVFARHNQKPYVADTGSDGWHKSDAMELSQWFVTQFAHHGAQLQRLIHYFKGWTDTVASRYTLPSNLILTLYAAEAFIPAASDAESFTRTVAAMAQRIQASYTLYNPMEPAELITRRLTNIQKEDGRTAIQELATIAEQAYTTSNPLTWQHMLGSRFPLEENT